MAHTWHPDGNTYAPSTWGFIVDRRDGNPTGRASGAGASFDRTRSSKLGERWETPRPVARHAPQRISSPPDVPGRICLYEIYCTSTFFVASASNADILLTWHPSCDT